jgi:NAD(P)-dependent dehydrogenase (short-subunit alcohol dehydrogenase family)
MGNREFEGRTATITGAARGIGLAVAHRLVEGGASVCLWDIDAVRLKAARSEFDDNGNVHTVVVDITSLTSVLNAVETTELELGPIDIHVNSAGVAGANFTTWEYPLEEWNQVLAVNLTGTFLCCKAVLPTMIERGYGRIVNIASIAGKEGNPNAVAYSASKAGVIGLTKTLGKETHENGVLVNCITPAVIDTEILSQLTEEHISYMLSKIPLGRLGQPKEVAELVAWLSSEACSFSTGAVFDISGGRATY